MSVKISLQALFSPKLSDSFLLRGSILRNTKQKTFWIDLTEWVIHFRPIQIAFPFIFSNLQPLVTERIAQLRFNAFLIPYILFVNCVKIVDLSFISRVK